MQFLTIFAAAALISPPAAQAAGTPQADIGKSRELVTACETDRIEIAVQNCNIKILPHAGDNIVLEYSPLTGQIRTTQEHAVLQIGITGTAQVVEKESRDTAVLLLPAGDYEYIRLVAADAGVNVAAPNTDLTVTARNSAVRITVPVSYSKDLFWQQERGAGILELNPDASSYVVQATMEKSLLATPPGWPGQEFGEEYFYSSGSAKANFHIRHTGGVFQIALLSQDGD